MRTAQRRRAGAAPALTLSVTQRDIDAGTQKNAAACMTAQAILRQFPTAIYIMCNTREVSFSLPEQRERRRYFNSALGSVMVAKFDQGEIVAPFRLRLNEGIAFPMGWREKHPGMGADPRRVYKRTGKKATRYTKRREFGACVLEDSAQLLGKP